MLNKTMAIQKWGIIDNKWLVYHKCAIVESDNHTKKEICFTILFSFFAFVSRWRISYSVFVHFGAKTVLWDGIYTMISLSICIRNDCVCNQNETIYN